MQRSALIIAMMAAGLLAACGGGGGGDPTTPASTSVNLSVSGVAAKGLMAKAQVTAHKVKADGSVDDTPIAGPVTTDDNGAYTLQVPTTKGEPYVIKVTATAQTTHRDEVSGAAVPLPSGFTMRAVQVAPSTETATVSTSVTPFSEMEVKAAETAGGVTKANTEQAKASVSQLLGFDPTSVQVKKPEDLATASTDQQKLGLMLTAVAQMASTGALGCNTGEAGDRTKCVVEALAKAAKTTSVKLEDSSGGETRDVSGALSTALSAVLADDNLRKGVSDTVVVSIEDNLKCSTNCTVATATQLGAIAKAKALFENLRSDWALWLGSASGATNTVSGEAGRFVATARSAQVPVEALVKDVGAITNCVRLYADYVGGRSSATSRSGSFNATSGSGVFAGELATLAGYGCTLFKDDPSTTASPAVATSPAEARYIGMQAIFFYQRAAGVTGLSRYRHAFVLTPDAATPGKFSYASRARKTTRVCTTPVNGPTTCSDTANESLQANGYSGTVTVTADASGDLTGVTIAGKLPASFKNNSGELANDHMVVDFGAAVTSGTDGSLALNVAQSSLTTYTSTDESAKDAAITIKPSGVQTVVLDALGNLQPNSLTLNLVVGHTQGEFEGLLSMTDPVWDKSHTVMAPQTLRLSGMLRNIAGGVSTEFVSGELTVKGTGYANFDQTLPGSDSNFFTMGITFVGKVTAPGRPVLEYTVGVTLPSHTDSPDAITGQYRALNASGVPTMVVNLTTTKSSSVPGGFDVSLTETSSQLKFHVQADQEVAKLLQGDVLVGVLDRGNRRLTFADNTFTSLDFGL